MKTKSNMTDKGKKIKHILLDESFGSGNFEYVLGKGLRLDMVRIIMKINEIINYLNNEK